MRRLRNIRRLATAFVMACVALPAGLATAHAQSAAQPPPAAALTAEQATAFALSDQPIAADRLAMGHRFAQAMTLSDSTSATIDLLYASMREQTAAALPADMPPEDKARFMAAVDEAMAGLKADQLAKLDLGYSRYFAVSMSPAALAAATTFYETPLGRKVVRSPMTMTKAENDALNQYAADHPEMLEGVAAMLGGALLGQKIMARERAGMGPAFRARFCQSLKARGLDAPACKTT